MWVGVESDCKIVENNLYNWILKKKIVCEKT